MKKSLSIKGISILVMVLVVFYSCSVVPVTGRKQVSLLPESQLVEMAFTSYGEFLDTHKLSSDAPKTAMVRNKDLFFRV